MRLYSGKIPSVGTEIVKSSRRGGRHRGDRSGRGRDGRAGGAQGVPPPRPRDHREGQGHPAEANLPYEQFGKVKRTLAGEKAFGLGEDGLEWMTTQMIESFMQSPHIEEIFVEDTVLRKRMADVLKKHMQVDEELDEEVRRRIKNLRGRDLHLGGRVRQGPRSDQAEPRPGSVADASGAVSGH